ncbi:MAG: hypothetical protein AAF557_07675 [Pseudomonadota bacterium]
MASILIVGDARTNSSWCEVLHREGHSVECCENAIEFQSRFASDPVDIFIVDVTHADWGEAMLVPQVRAAWPDCKIMAISSNYAFRSSAVYQMGLWTPDQLLIKPINPRVLCATVSFLWAQIRSTKIRTMVSEQPLSSQRAEGSIDGDAEPAKASGPLDQSGGIG